MHGVSLKGMAEVASGKGFSTLCCKITLNGLSKISLPVILHWNQNHFVVLYRISGRGKYFHILDPAKGKVRISREEMEKHWLSNKTGSKKYGILLMLEPAEETIDSKCHDKNGNKRNQAGFVRHYLKKYRSQFIVIATAMILGCVLQILLPFLTQAIVDLGLPHKDISLIWLILAGELMIVAGNTVTDFIKRRLLLHISMRVNLSLVRDFFLKLFRLPMSFFDSRQMGDLLQRITDHARVQRFLTEQLIGSLFSFMTFAVLSVVLFIYDIRIFLIFIIGSLIYIIWFSAFLKKRRVLDYDLFSTNAVNNSRTYQLVTSMQEIKIQNCEKRRCREWEDTQEELFDVQLRQLDLRQKQTAGAIFINEVKNLVIIAVTASAVINGSMTLGEMMAVQYITGQLNSPVDSFMSLLYSLQDVGISLERINEIHDSPDEEKTDNQCRNF